MHILSLLCFIWVERIIKKSNSTNQGANRKSMLILVYISWKKYQQASSKSQQAISNSGDCLGKIGQHFEQNIAIAYLVKKGIKNMNTGSFKTNKNLQKITWLHALYTSPHTTIYFISSILDAYCYFYFSEYKTMSLMSMHLHHWGHIYIMRESKVKIS